MSNIILIAVCLLITIPMAVGTWLGLRLTGRKFAFKNGRAPLRRRLLIGVIVTAAVLVGSWIGNRGDLRDPIALYATAMTWLIALAATFCTVKKT